MNGQAQPPVVGVIGGSGIYEIDGLTDVQWVGVESSFGAPSDELCIGALDGQKTTRKKRPTTPVKGRLAGEFQTSPTYIDAKPITR